MAVRLDLVPWIVKIYESYFALHSQVKQLLLKSRACDAVFLLIIFQGQRFRELALELSQAHLILNGHS